MAILHPLSNPVNLIQGPLHQVRLLHQTLIMSLQPPQAPSSQFRRPHNNSSQGRVVELVSISVSATEKVPCSTHSPPKAATPPTPYHECQHSYVFRSIVVSM